MSQDEIEGLVFGNIEAGSMYAAATGDVTAATSSTDSEIKALYGRLIGFGVTVARHTHGTNEQIVRISMIYNDCSCSGSSFIVTSDNRPKPMRVIAGQNDKAF